MIVNKPLTNIVFFILKTSFSVIIALPGYNHAAITVLTTETKQAMRNS
jgi:hypothetical protein